MVTIQDIIKSFKDEGLNDIAIANKLGISQPMVSQYKRGFKASLDVIVIETCLVLTIIIIFMSFYEFK